MDECDDLTFENCMLKDVCAKSEKVDLEMKNLVLLDDLNKFKETLSLKEEVFATDFAKLENESLELKPKVESLLDDNNKLLDKFNQIELELAVKALEQGLSCAELAK